MLNVACVWVRPSTKFAPDHVFRLRAMVFRHLPIPHRFVCFTDRPGELPGIETRDVSHLGLDGWFTKMALFSPEFRGPGRTIYLDLDTVVVGDLSPLARVDAPFGICGNFTRAGGNRTWPCRYGSCAMTFGEGFGDRVWRDFQADRESLMARFQTYGDQRVVEELVPDAAILQERLPPGFFLHYRNLSRSRPAAARVVVFGGRNTPDNCEIDWLREEWR